MQKIESFEGVLENFPNVKLSYEEFVHKKVSDADSARKEVLYLVHDLEKSIRMLSY